jgi:hypothetical protein
LTIISTAVKFFRVEEGLI